MNLLERIKKELSKTSGSAGASVHKLNFSATEIPRIVEKRGSDWVLWGEKNDYPDMIDDLSYGSPIHGAILKTKTKMTHGKGILINDSVDQDSSKQVIESLPDLQKAEVKFLLDNKHGGEPLFNVLKKVARDFQKYGALSYELIFNTDFTKIAGVRHVPTARLRAGKMNEHEVVHTYFYSRDWKQYTKTEYRPVPRLAYWEGNKESANQIIYKKEGELDYYGTPAYVGAINWIVIDLQMGIFHKCNIENGMNPGMHFRFFKLPENETQKEEILRELQNNLQGAARAGNFFATFSDGKDEALEVQPVQTSQIDKQLVHLAELSDRKILSGHQLTSPLLAGISTSGQLGGATELEIGAKLFDGISMASDREILEKEIQWIFDFNKCGVKTSIDKFNPVL